MTTFLYRQHVDLVAVVGTANCKHDAPEFAHMTILEQHRTVWIGRDHKVNPISTFLPWAGLPLTILF